MRAGQINGSKQDLSVEQNVLAAIRIQPEIGLVILFGSLARGQAHAQSDLVDLRAIGEPLLGQILRHGKRLLGSDTQYANLIRRHLFDQADYLPYRDRILAERRRAWIGK